MSVLNVANINAPSITLVATTATALSTIGQTGLILIDNPTATGAYVETGSSGVTSTSLKGYVGAGSKQLFRRNPTDTHIISTVAGLIVQGVTGS